MSTVECAEPDVDDVIIWRPHDPNAAAVDDEASSVASMATETFDDQHLLRPLTEHILANQDNIEGHRLDGRLRLVPLPAPDAGRYVLDAPTASKVPSTFLHPQLYRKM